mmetsp:Transcript_21076/g.30554  ORF Transcript_21076/g.30554 Transcript_21076/m.30554 type:complete len:104 (+) Transcript_21076:409-720(+)
MKIFPNQQTYIERQKDMYTFNLFSSPRVPPLAYDSKSSGLCFKRMNNVVRSSTVLLCPISTGAPVNLANKLGYNFSDKQRLSNAGGYASNIVPTPSDQVGDDA